MRVIVTGGAGYIGSVAVEKLLARGDEVVVVDNLWRGHAEAVESPAELVSVDTRDTAAMSDLFSRVQPEAVLHFAAATIVPESVSQPDLYYAVNTYGTLNLLASMRQANVDRLVFSSTAAVYGSPAVIPVKEDQALEPVSPYGWSKLMAEQMIRSHAEAFGLRFAALRYFNVAGATEAHGEQHDPETHLVPSALQAVRGERPPLPVFGADYPTRDGSAVRDYVHVVDLVDAHLLALEALSEGSLGALNLGTTEGFTVFEVLNAIERITGQPVPRTLADRREGDPPVLIADATKARSQLGWHPTRSTLPDIVHSAWNWMMAHPEGYCDENSPQKDAEAGS